MISAADIAAVLLARLRQLRGPDVTVEAVDFVDCEDDCSLMAYVYVDGDDCEPLCFSRPPFFDPAELETLMMRGGVPVMLH